MADLSCDVTIIGAGTAGLAAERTARKAGAKTLLIGGPRRDHGKEPVLLKVRDRDTGGIWSNWTSVRKFKEGETPNDIFAFLTTEPNAEVGAIHRRRCRVILMTPDEVETWMTAPPDEALKLQRPVPDGTLRTVVRGVKEDPAGTAT
jgi:putative SOS response-associated peptidase YedK